MRVLRRISPFALLAAPTQPTSCGDPPGDRVDVRHPPPSINPLAYIHKPIPPVCSLSLSLSHSPYLEGCAEIALSTRLLGSDFSTRSSNYLNAMEEPTAPCCLPFLLTEETWLG
jgi:hypothetical protein